MKKKPKAILHMLVWGVDSGGLFAIVYFLSIFGFFTTANSILDPILYIDLSKTVLTAFIVGAIFGLGFGLVDGFILKILTLHISARFAKDEINTIRKIIYPIIFVIPIGIPLVFTLAKYGLNFKASLTNQWILFVLIPPLSAAIASTYAAHRYLFRLRLWSESQDTRKSKAKNDALTVQHLSDENIEQNHLMMIGIKADEQRLQK